MYATVSERLQPEGKSVQQRWMLAHDMEEPVAAVVIMDVQAVTLDVLWELGLSVETLVGKVEAKLCAVNKASESCPMGFELWAPETVGLEIEAMSAVECVRPHYRS